MLAHRVRLVPWWLLCLWVCCVVRTAAADEPTETAPDEVLNGDEAEPSDVDERDSEPSGFLIGLRPPPRQLEVLPGAMARGIGEVEGRGVWLGTADRRFVFRYSGFVHLDIRERLSLESSGIEHETVSMVRRARFAFEGTTFGNLDYRVMFDPAVELLPLDAYLDWRATAEVNLRIGRFKSPFGFERRARAFSLAFNERGFPNSLSPNRDIGVFIHGQSIDGFVSYDVALLSGSADLESIDSIRDAPDLVGRIYLQPFRLTNDLEVLRHLGIGFSASAGTEHGSAQADDRRLAAVRTTVRSMFFAYRSGQNDDAVAFADGKRQRWSLHGHYRHKRFNGLWEYVKSGQRVTAGDQSRFIAHQAFQLYAGYALTDDEWTFFGIVPKRPFDPDQGQYGAAALAVRYHMVSFDRGAFPVFADPTVAVRAAHAASASFHWILSQNLSGQFDVEQVFFVGGAEAAGNRASELSITARIQAFY